MSWIGVLIILICMALYYYNDADTFIFVSLTSIVVSLVSTKYNISITGGKDVNKDESIKKKATLIPTEPEDYKRRAILYFGKNVPELQYTDRSIYEAATYKHAKLITDIFSELIGNLSDKVIVEANAGLGGNTNGFAEKFKQVHSIEFDKTTLEASKHNMNQLGHTNVQYHHGDCLKLLPKVIKKYKPYIAYFDPPWGVNYKKVKSSTMGYGNTDVRVPIFKMSKTVPLVAMRTPSNYEIDNFINDAKEYYKNIQTFTVTNKLNNKPIFMMILLSNIISLSATEDIDITRPRINYDKDRKYTGMIRKKDELKFNKINNLAKSVNQVDKPGL